MNKHYLCIKNLFFIKVAFFALILPISGAFAIGGVNGGGGKGVLCGGRLKLLDLYEAELHGLTIPLATGSTDEEVELYFPRFLNHFKTAPIKESEIQSGIRIIKDSINQMDNASIRSNLSDFNFKFESNLLFTNDATLPPLKPGCEFVQIAFHQIIKEGSEDKIEITVDPLLWKMLNSINKFALFYHEFIYSRTRFGYELTDLQRSKLKSDEFRKVVGLLLSGVKVPTIIGSMGERKQKIWCGFGGGKVHGGNEEHFEIYIQPEIKFHQKGLGFYFYGFKEMLVGSRTYAFIPNLTTAQILRKSNGVGINSLKNFALDYPSKLFIIENKLMSKRWGAELGVDEYGLNLQVFDLKKRPSKAPNKSAGFCSIVNDK